MRGNQIDRRGWKDWKEEKTSHCQESQKECKKRIQKGREDKKEDKDKRRKTKKRKRDVDDDEVELEFVLEIKDDE